VESSNRRGFLRALMRDAAKGAQEAVKVVGPPGLGPLLSGVTGGESAQADVVEAGPTAFTAPALATPRTPIRVTTIGELIEMAHELGLTDHDDALRNLAQRGTRLTPGAIDEFAWIGGGPELPDDIDWPHWGGGLLDLIVQIDLSRTDLHIGGHLMLFFDTVRAPSGLTPGAEEAARAIVVHDALAAPPRGGEPMRVSRELMLPRVWAESVQILDLEPEEQTAYQRLRAKLAEVQGVELEDGAGMGTAYNRVLGLPNETSGQMPRICELTSRGFASDDYDAVPEAETAWERWRLLAQISGTTAGRLFFWIPNEDLAAGDFSNVRVIPQET
jgi:hypothetical protein